MDCDGHVDNIEIYTGSHPMNAASTPETKGIPATCADGLDNDGDGAIDGADMLDPTSVSPSCDLTETVHDFQFPSVAGLDIMDSRATVDPSALGLPPGEVMEFRGPVVVSRTAVQTRPGTGERFFDTEMLAMQLTSVAPITVCPGRSCPDGGTFTSGLNVQPRFTFMIVEDPTEESRGQVNSHNNDPRQSDYPATSFFDVHTRITSGVGPFQKEIAAREDTVTNPEIRVIPPVQPKNGRCYFVPPVINHCPLEPQVPVYSIAFGSPSTTFGLSPCDPADLLTLPGLGPACGAAGVSVFLPCAGLGLNCLSDPLPGSDDVDALSFGYEKFDTVPAVFLSVRPGAAGCPASGVAAHAAIGHPETDEFASVPAAPPPLACTGTNVVFNSAPVLGLLEVTAIGTDDTDGLAWSPGTTGSAPLPVWYSLTPGSASLLAIPAGPADILVTLAAGGLPVVAIQETALGLVAPTPLAPGDDIDGLCMWGPADPPDPTVPPGPLPPLAFSLAAGSPTLAVIGATEADLLLPGFPPTIWLYGDQYGILSFGVAGATSPPDDLDAVKCEGQPPQAQPPPGEIHGTKWWDVDRNGQRDAGEPGLEGWFIQAVGGGGASFTAMTMGNDPATPEDDTGMYWLVGLPTDTYTVSELQQEGWVQTFPVAPGVHTVTLGPGQVVTGIDFGNQREPGTSVP